MKEFYTCSQSTNPSSLLRVGAVAHPLSYSYEVRTPLLLSDGGDTASSSTAANAGEDDNVNEAVGRIQHALLQSVATRSGLDDCVISVTQARGGWRRRGLLLRHDSGESEYDDRRRLLPKERGSTSIVGVSLLPGDVIDEDAKCSNDIASASTPNSFWSPDEEDTEQTTSGIVEDETNTSNPLENTDIVDTDIVDVRTDGKIGLLRSNHNILTQKDNDDAQTAQHDVVNNYSNDHSAFNFISTQSKSLTRNSYTRSHDPLVPLSTRDDFTATPRITTRCTVVKGYMTLYTYDNNEYENIEVRTVHAIQHDMEDGNFVAEHLLNDVVLGVSFIGSNITDNAGSTSVKDSIASSPGFVTSIIGSPAAATSGTTGSETLDMFTFPVMILIALGTILIVLTALFVGTSKTASRKRRRYANDNPQYDYDNDLFLQEVKPADVYDRDGSTINTSYGEEYDAEDYFHKLSRTFTGFSNQAQLNGDNNVDDDDEDELSVFETYETTVKGNDGVCIRGMRSYADEDYEDCFSISSVHADLHPRSTRLPLPTPGRIFALSRSRDAMDDNRQLDSRNNISRHNGILPTPGRISRKAAPPPTTNAPRVMASTSRDVIEIEASGLSSCDSLRSIPSTPGKTNKSPRRSYPTPSSLMTSRSPKRSRQKTRKEDSSRKNDPLDVVDGIEVTLVEI